MSTLNKLSDCQVTGAANTHEQDSSPADRLGTGTTPGKLVVFAGVSVPVTDPEKAAAFEVAVATLLAAVKAGPRRNPQGLVAGWGPTHAAQLLVQLSPELAVDPLLDVLAINTRLTLWYEPVFKALSLLGARLIEPILARLPTAVQDYRRDLLCLLAGVGVRAPRVFEQLLAALTELPEEGAMLLAEYGDPAALSHLSRALDDYEANLPHGGRGDSTIFELREAIESLGGSLTLSQQAKYEHALQVRRIEVALQSRAQQASWPT